MEKTNIPEKRFSTGAIQVTVWKNMANTKDGKVGEYHTFGFSRRYKDQATGVWKSTSSLRVNDLPKAIVALNKAYEYAVLRVNHEEEEVII